MRELIRHPDITNYTAVFHHPPSETCGLADPRSKYYIQPKLIRGITRDDVAQAISEDKKYIPNCLVCGSLYILDKVVPVQEYDFGDK